MNQKKVCRLYLNDKTLCRGYAQDSDELIDAISLVSVARTREFKTYIGKYSKTILHCRRFNDIPAPFLMMGMCWLLSLGHVKWSDAKEKEKKITLAVIFANLFLYIYESIACKKAMASVEKDISELEIRLTNRKKVILNPENKKCMYLRLDHTFGLSAGGSVGHIAGVINNLKRLGYEPAFFSADEVVTVDSSVCKITLDKDLPYRNVNGVAAYVGNLTDYPVIKDYADKTNPAFIYQRSGLELYAGAKLALENKLPLILEYNGSEIWCQKNWGSGSIKDLDLAERIEKLTFEVADLIVCVSTPLKEQLVEQGIDADKIIVNPNGVEPEVYYPEIDGSEIRDKYGINKNDVVVGFIGTFGAWHGAELLAQAYANYVRKNKEAKIHLLMIGDGGKMPEVKKAVETVDPGKFTLTGMVPQKEGPKYLAACDILVNSTIPNKDGTPFFGSPTKMFEYMAMGRATIASDMDQMSEVLEHDKTALMVEPGNVDAIEAAIDRLVKDETLRKTLGDNARTKAIEEYTWEKHVQKIISHLYRE